MHIDRILHRFEMTRVDVRESRESEGEERDGRNITREESWYTIKLGLIRRK